MFDIIMYTNTSEHIKIDKNLTNIASLYGELNNESSIVNPVIMVEANRAQITKCNYIYIPDFGRYYYVTDAVAVRNGLWQLSCKVDVLMSNKDAIRNLNAIIAKNEKTYNLLLNDGSLQVYSNPHVITKTYPNGFGTDYTPILCVLG